MAQYKANISPFINVEFYVTSVWWELPRNHRGLDIATPSSLGNVPLYSMCNGRVVNKGDDPDGFGYYIIMKDDLTRLGFLYAHLHQASHLNIGDTVSIGSHVGYEGTTGNSTGIHLHLEMQDLTSHEWIFNADKSYYINPATYMGFPNEEGISVIYEGTPITPPDDPGGDTPTTKKKKGYNFVLFGRRRRIYG